MPANSKHTVANCAVCAGAAYGAWPYGHGPGPSCQRDAEHLRCGQRRADHPRSAGTNFRWARAISQPPAGIQYQNSGNRASELSGGILNTARRSTHDECERSRLVKRLSRNQTGFRSGGDGQNAARIAEEREGRRAANAARGGPGQRVAGWARRSHPLAWSVGSHQLAGATDSATRAASWRDCRTIQVVECSGTSRRTPI